MKAEIIATGREILSGDIIDTNSNYITGKLSEAGLNVLYHHVTGDDEFLLASLLEKASMRSEIIVVSGGLGPTEDDKSRIAASIAVKRELCLNREALKSVENFFIKRKLEMPEENKIQAYIPEKARSFENKFGTAPGFYMELNKARIYFLPGVPYELKNLVDDFLIQDIQGFLDLDFYSLNEKITVFGLPESRAGSLVSDFYEKFPKNTEVFLDLGIQAVIPHIFIKLYGRSKNRLKLENACQKAKKYILERLETHIISFSGETLNQLAARLLIKNKVTLSTAESCTGGLIANLLTDVSGSSAYFNMSAVTYSNQSKTDILGVKSQTIKTHGAVSKETAMELAHGARIKGKSDFGIATTGIAGPDGGVPGKNVGTVFIGFSSSKETKAFRFERDFKDRLLNKKIFAAAALHYLVKELEKL